MGATYTLLVLLGLAPAALAEAPRAPGAEPLALVNGEPITLDEYWDALGEMHRTAHDAGPGAAASVPRKDPTELLERLVKLELFLQEARAIGLEELPEFEKALERFHEDTLRVALLEHAGSRASAPPEEEVERIYAAMAEQIELALVLFRERERAEAFRAEVAAGAAFVELAERRMAEKAAERFDPPRFLRRVELLPAVLAAVEGASPGAVVGPVDLGRGHGVVRFLGKRVPQDPEVRREAVRQATAARRTEAIRGYVEGLRGKHVRVDEELLRGLDFDDAERFDAFLGDDRVVAAVEGGEPIRVRDVAQIVKGRLFHGVARAAEKGRLDKSKANALEQLVTERVIHDEALRLGLDRTPEFLAERERYADAVLFGLFVQRAIDPSVRLTPEEVESFYAGHVGEYTSPEMVRVESVTFDEEAAARHALERLVAGADLEWTRGNAEHVVPTSDLDPDLRFDRRLLTLDSLPGGVREAIAGAEPGSYRSYVERPDRHHVLRLVERIPAVPRPLDEVREDVARRAFDAKREAVLDDWAARLREASEVEVLVDAERLRSLTMGAASLPPG